MIRSFFLLLLFSFCYGERSPFITSVYKVSIPSYPGAYNASFVRYKNGFLMAFRNDHYRLPLDSPENLPFYTQSIGLVELDAHLRPLSEPVILKKVGNRAHDPRLFTIGDEIYLLYVSPPKGASHSCVGSEMYLTKVNRGFNVDSPLLLKAPVKKQWEKNWAPFVYGGNLYLSYTVNPHAVFQPSLVDGVCFQYSWSHPPVNWPWGTIRGGTPAVLVDGHYLAFFHSARDDFDTKHYTYFIGAYTFEAEPPFRLKQVSKTPFVHPDFYSTPKTPLTNSLVLFPAGLIVEGNRIFISYGENDGAIKVMELDKEKLYESLIDVPPQKKSLDIFSYNALESVMK